MKSLKRIKLYAVLNIKQNLDLLYFVQGQPSEATRIIENGGVFFFTFSLLFWQFSDLF